MMCEKHERLENLKLHEHEPTINNYAVDPRVRGQLWSCGDASSCGLYPFCANVGVFHGPAVLTLHSAVPCLRALADRMAEFSVEKQERKLPFAQNFRQERLDHEPAVEQRLFDCTTIAFLFIEPETMRRVTTAGDRGLDHNVAPAPRTRECEAI